MSDAQQKNLLRRKYEKILQSHTERDRRNKTLIIRDHLEDLPEWNASKSPCIFLSTLNEVDTSLIIDDKKTYAVLKWQNDTFIPVVFEGWDKVKKNKWGVLEPQNESQIDPTTIDAIGIPGLAFSRSGGRLGRGMGFYDRFLQDLNAPKIGICFENQLEENIPREPWDVSMDIIVTETQIIRP